MKLKRVALTILWTIGFCAAGFSLDNGLARTPPMGWNPWNAFSSGPQNEALIQETADSIVSSGMKDAGYLFVGPDDGVMFYRDINGHLQSNFKRYPSGMKGMGDSLHNMGLKLFLYTDVGTRTCTGDMPGTKDYEGDDARSLASWNCDYIKVDWCNSGGLTPQAAYTKLRDSLLACGRPIVYSICNWGVAYPNTWGKATGNLWRTGGDIGETWSAVLSAANGNAGLYASAGPGAWNDPDMLEVGNNRSGSGMNDVQARTHFSLWCIMASPLIAGNDVRNMSAASRATLTNQEAIGVNQDPLGIQGRKVRTVGSAEVWAGKKLFDNGFAALAFNHGGSAMNITVRWSDLGATAGTSLYVRDLWKHTTSGPVKDSVVVNVATDEAAFLRFSPVDSFPVPPVIVADKYLLRFASSLGQPTPLTDSIVLTNKGGDALPLWTIQENASWLSVNVNQKGKSQSLVATVHSGSLAAGKYHEVVKSNNIEPRSGLAMSMVTWDVELEVTDPNAVAPVWKQIDDAHASVTYTGSWALHQNDPADYNGTVHWNDQAGTTAQFTFQGSSVRLYGRRQNNGGTGKIYLDGVLAANGVNGYTCCWETLNKILLFEKSGLSNSTHTLKVEVEGQKGDAAGYGTFVVIDAVEYTSDPVTALEKLQSAAVADLSAGPNPFNGSLKIRYQLGAEGNTSLSLYALNGKKIVTLHSGWEREGRHELSWNGKKGPGLILASGTYMLVLKTTSASLKRKVIFLK